MVGVLRLAKCAGAKHDRYGCHGVAGRAPTRAHRSTVSSFGQKLDPAGRLADFNGDIVTIIRPVGLGGPAALLLLQDLDALGDALAADGDPVRAGNHMVGFGVRLAAV